MYIGADYYPEHWEKRRRKTDARLMKKAGFNVVRMAEFAWANMEPREGIYEFAWLEEALGILRSQGISAILGTPTAIVPAWMARKYPEIMATKSDGTRLAWGVRKDQCYTSGAFRKFSSEIVTAMASHFRDTPNVIGWQTDNEFAGPECFCESCRIGFQEWLRKKYRTLDSLNKAWGTHFWGHLVGDWDEILLPTNMNGDNPGILLDWRRYHSWLNVEFQRSQLKILRRICPNHFVTHNFEGLHTRLNYYDLAADLDFVSWDNYPVWGKPEVRYTASLAADVMRGLKRRNFWIMEQTAGPGGWGTFGRTPHPGEIRNVAYQQLAHGCDGQVWFRWRTCTAGREQYWHGLLGHDGRPLRRYKEAAATAGEYRKLWREIEGTTIKTKVAMIYDYDSIWAFQIQMGYKDASHVDAVTRWYRALFRAGINVDMVPPDADLSGYRLVLAPHLNVLPDSIADNLESFVRKGGVLLTDCRTAVKDETNLCHASTLPGRLTDALGITIEEYERIPDGVEYSIEGSSELKGRFAAVKYVDWIKPSKAEKIAGLNEWHLKKFAAVTRNRFGKGNGWYVGAVSEQEEFYDRLVSLVLKDARVKPPLTPVEGVEVSVRQGRGRKLLFLLNHTETSREIPVPTGKKELITGRKTGSTLCLQRYGVAVIKLK